MIILPIDTATTDIPPEEKDIVRKTRVASQCLIDHDLTLKEFTWIFFLLRRRCLSRTTRQRSYIDGRMKSAKNVLLVHLIRDILFFKRELYVARMMYDNWR